MEWVFGFVFFLVAENVQHFFALRGQFCETSTFIRGNRSSPFSIKRGGFVAFDDNDRVRKIDIGASTQGTEPQLFVVFRGATIVHLSFKIRHSVQVLANTSGTDAIESHLLFFFCYLLLLNSYLSS